MFDESIFLETESVEFIFNKHTGLVQVCMGGEWWSGRVKLGKNVLIHRKQDLDECYKPVLVSIEELDQPDNYEITITGGFGAGAIFRVGKDYPNDKSH